MSYRARVRVTTPIRCLCLALRRDPTMSRSGSSAWLPRAGLLAAWFGLAGVLSFLAYGTARLRVVEGRAIAATSERDSVSALAHVLRDRVASIGADLDASRCALGAASGINAYHEGEFTLAVELYDQALACDPADGDVLNLKAYSLFKSGDSESALETQLRGLAVAPDDAWGFFNLARYLCAVGDTEAAAAQMATAISLSPGMAAIASGDGEFQSLCGGPKQP